MSDAKATIPRRQRGVAVLVGLLMVLGIGVAVLTASAVRGVPVQTRVEQRTVKALLEAKQALVGRAVADNDRPGSLPCPDIDDDGLADGPVAGSCPSYVGRLPWKTLGLTDLRDESGERLWYVLSARFHDDPSAIINSDTRATDIIVYKDATTQVLAPEAAAVIFAPGSAVANQIRDATLAPCAIPGGTIARSLCAANYLDAAAGVDNGVPVLVPAVTGRRELIAGQRGAGFNDRLMVLMTTELMPLVEQRVGIEVRDALIEYRLNTGANGYYPWAANILGASVPTWNRGHVPDAALAIPAWPGKASKPPAWFDANRWNEVIYYAVGRSELQLDGAACVTCLQPYLSISTVPGYAALIIMPGAAPGVPRLPGTWAQYVDDPDNQTPLLPLPSDDAYVWPASTGHPRDRMFVTPGPSPAQCGLNGSMLAANVPCLVKGPSGSGKRQLKPICQLAKENIEKAPCGGTCVKAADTLTKKPCSRKLRKTECKAAVSNAKVCGP